MKKFTFKGVLDGFRSSVTQGGPNPPPKVEQEITENLKPENFTVTKTFCHGFPYQPTAMAYDPMQKLLAIGTKNGCLRILGRPGVDIHARHDPECSAVLHLQFIQNEGGLVSATADDSLHLWDLRSSKKPQVVHSLKFQRERVTCLQLPFQSKWLFVGTERGNIHVVNIDTFELSGYLINWNKAIELSRKTHPGAIVYLGDNPCDPNKLLIGFETGQLVLWDLKNKCAELRFQGPDSLKSVAWHSEGKQFMCSHSDGSLTTWNIRQNLKPISTTWPHARNTKEGKPEPCKPIQKVEWKSSKTGDNFVIFSGGLTVDRAGKTPSLSVIHGKTTTVLEMEYNVLDFIALSESQWESEIQDPYAIVVLLQQDIVVIDLLTPGYPCFENPYPMDIHESAVTSCIYVADCPGDLIPALYSVGSKAQKKTGFSDKEWPVDGGQWGSTSCSYAEIIITGHADGSLKFWDASSTTLQVLYKLKTSKPFERLKKSRSNESADDDPFAVQQIVLCPESRYLAIAGASCHVILYKFKKHEHTSEVLVLEIPIIYDEEVCTGGFDFSKPSEGRLDYFVPIRVKSGPQKKSPGYQAEIVCLTPWVNGEPPGCITTLAVNSSYGLMAYGNESGLAIIDIVQKMCLFSMGTPDLYGMADPYQRAPRSPKKPPDVSEEKSPTEQVVELVELTPNNTPAEDESASTSSEPNEVGGSFSEIEEEKPAEPEPQIPKCKSTTPTKQRSRGWTKMKFLIKKSLREKKLAQMNAPTDVNAGTSGAASNSNVIETKVMVTGAESNPEILETTPTPNRSSSPTSSEDLSFETETGSKAERPCDLPIPPPRTKRKSGLKKNKKSKCVDLRRNNNSNSISGLMKKILGRTSLSSVPSGGGGGGTSPRKNVGSGPPGSDPVRRSKSQGSQRKDNRSLSKCYSMAQSLGSEEEGHSFSSPNSPALPVSSSGPGAPSSKAHLLILSKQYYSFQSNSANVTSASYQQDKLDSNFTRSRSSSMSSLDNISSEAIQCLSFVGCMSKRNDYSVNPTLWVGTSLGSILLIGITLPPAGDARKSDPVIVTPSSTIFRLKGSILAMSFLDSNGILIPCMNEPWRDESREPKSSDTPTKISGQSPTQSQDSTSSDRQFAVLVSEKQSRIVALPSQNCIFKQQLCETSFVVKADVTTVKDSVCLVCYLSTGHLTIYSLPSLKLLIDVDFVPLSDLSFQQTRKGIVDPMLQIWGQQLFVNEDATQIAKTFCLSSFGHGMYLSSPSELQKFTISTDFYQIMDTMLGDLFLEREMPERPKEGFFTGLFGGGVRNFDREELFGETISGKGAKSIAKHIAGPQMDHLQMRSGTAAAEVARTRMLMVERGEKLGQLEDKTAKMMSDAENFSSAAHQLMLKYKDKKWYQL